MPVHFLKHLSCFASSKDEGEQPPPYRRRFGLPTSSLASVMSLGSPRSLSESPTPVPTLDKSPVESTIPTIRVDLVPTDQVSNTYDSVASLAPVSYHQVTKKILRPPTTRPPPPPVGYHKPKNVPDSLPVRQRGLPVTGEVTLSPPPVRMRNSKPHPPVGRRPRSQPLMGIGSLQESARGSYPQWFSETPGASRSTTFILVMSSISLTGSPFWFFNPMSLAGRRSVDVLSSGATTRDE